MFFFVFVKVDFIVTGVKGSFFILYPRVDVFDPNTLLFFTIGNLSLLFLSQNILRIFENKPRHGNISLILSLYLILAEIFCITVLYPLLTLVLRLNLILNCKTAHFRMYIKFCLFNTLFSVQ